VGICSGKLPDARLIHYTSDCEHGRLGRITATIDHRTKTLEVDDLPTREEVEEHFEMVGLG
jgi:hypothetical protein